ncbi:hypothetical protein APUTEX25_004686 [Auxenochlorella protothecoides]|uniref:Uncharacterized protein n=1 Tax=Auxenochlorella protothecoides TaxID=3075 RepID=A0A3M7L0Z8_AUXPR|nr:hypothetical protein APUTEX25_004686 [Auxenochlorella protothecoides]|eukprot:RMZ56463.1 hypothetical protein APUTEX25_004686 [Auxenochlorella protothecoides]
MQGLDWYKSSLRRDAEGDVAQHFLGEGSAAGGPPTATQRSRQLGRAAGQSRLVIESGDVRVLPASAGPAR